MDNFSTERNNCRRKLIYLVKQHPILWNKTHENYNRNRPQKLLTWAEISDQMGVEPDKIRRTWENLRDQYRRDLKREVKYGFKSKWRFFNDMDFIREMVTCKDQANELTDSDSDVETADASKCLEDGKSLHTDHIAVESELLTTEPNLTISKDDLTSSEFQPILLTRQWQQAAVAYPTTQSHIATLANCDSSKEYQQHLPTLVPMPNFSINQRQLPKRYTSSTPESTMLVPSAKYSTAQVNQKCDSSKDFHADLPNPIELMEMLAKREPDMDMGAECMPDMTANFSNSFESLDQASRFAQEFNQESHVSTSSRKRASMMTDDNNSQPPHCSSGPRKRQRSSESGDLDAKDEDYYFAMSLLPSMRQIPRNRKIALRIGIMNLIARDLEEVCK